MTSKIQSLNIDDPVVVRQELLKDCTFNIYSKVSAIINNNGFAGDVRTRAREIIKQS